MFDKYFARIGGVFTIISAAITPFLPKNIQGWVWIAIGGITLLWLSFYIGRRSVKRNTDNPALKQPFADALLDFFETKRKEGKDSEIIRWGLALSTPLWLSQKYEIRKAVGEFVENSAVTLGNTKALIKVLVDDIGWTSVELLDFNFADKKLNQAIKLAKENNEYVMLAKGYRHLFGLNFRQNNIEEAEKYLNLSLSVINDLDENVKKGEIIAEYHYAKSTLENKKGNFTEALSEIEKAKFEYEKLQDKAWIIKIMARKGEILISLNQIEEAKNLFVKGVGEAKQFQYNKQQVKNLIGLGMCYSLSGYNKKATEYFTEAQLIAEGIGMYYELEVIKREIIKLKSKG